jgi:membrane protease YdiL (CAAX protease family)
MAASPRARTAAFLVLTLALSTIFYVRIIADGRLRMLPTLGLMWCPAVAAIVVRLVTQRNLRGTGWGRGPVRWLAVSYLLPFGICAGVYGTVWLTGIGVVDKAGLAVAGFRDRNAPLAVVLLTLATLGFLSAIVFTLGEEIGWRGFLVPELSRTFDFTTTSLISGVIWSVYHYPAILFANYNAAAPKPFALVCFTWMIVASSFTFTWLRLKSGSVRTAVFLHASHNVFVQQVFDPLTRDRDWTTYVTTEFGVGLAIAYTVVAVYFWRRRYEVAPATR